MSMMITDKSHLQKCIAVAVDNIIFQASETGLIIVTEVKFFVFKLILRLLDFHSPVRLGKPTLSGFSCYFSGKY